MYALASTASAAGLVYCDHLAHHEEHHDELETEHEADEGPHFEFVELYLSEAHGDHQHYSLQLSHHLMSNTETVIPAPVFLAEVELASTAYQNLDVNHESRVSLWRPPVFYEPLKNIILLI